MWKKTLFINVQSYLHFNSQWVDSQFSCVCVCERERLCGGMFLKRRGIRAPNNLSVRVKIKFFSHPQKIKP